MELRKYHTGHSFTRWGQTWTIEKRSGDVALIRQDFPGGNQRFTVAIVLHHLRDRTLPLGSTVNAGDEYLPGANDYGQTAWQWCRRETAERHFQTIKHNLNRKSA